MILRTAVRRPLARSRKRILGDSPGRSDSWARQRKTSRAGVRPCIPAQPCDTRHSTHRCSIVQTLQPFLTRSSPLLGPHIHVQPLGPRGSCARSRRRPDLAAFRPNSAPAPRSRLHPSVGSHLLAKALQSSPRRPDSATQSMELLGAGVRATLPCAAFVTRGILALTRARRPDVANRRPRKASGAPQIEKTFP